MGLRTNNNIFDQEGKIKSPPSVKTEGEAVEGQGEGEWMP